MNSLTHIKYRKNGKCYGLDLETYSIVELNGKFAISGTFRRSRDYDEVETCRVVADVIEEVKTSEYICPTGPRFSDYVKDTEGYRLSPYGGWHIGDAPDGHSYYFHQHTIRDGHSGEDLVVSYEKELIK